jgi:cell division protein FtsB
MKKEYIKIRNKIEKSLIGKLIKAKQEIKYLRKKNEELQQQNHDLIDEMVLKQIKIRELSLGDKENECKRNV